MARVYTSRDAFGRIGVKELTDNDWWLGSATPTSLKSERPHVILFYQMERNTDPDNEPLFLIWRELARTIAGPVIASVNASERDAIMNAFASVAADLDNPLHDFTGFGFPTIIVYRNRWPQAYYNGELSYDAIKKWILVLAMTPGYTERRSLFHGVSAVEPDFYAEDTRVEDYPYPTSSRDFTAFTGENPRGGDSAVVQPGFEDEGGEQTTTTTIVEPAPAEEVQETVVEDVPVEETEEVIYEEAPSEEEIIVEQPAGSTTVVEQASSDDDVGYIETRG